MYRYIDYELAHPGASYFGASNAARLSEIARCRDPLGVLATPASSYLYPSESKDNAVDILPSDIDIYVGSFSDVISHWRLHSDGSLTFMQSVAAALRNPSWLVTGAREEIKYMYAVNQVKDALPNQTIALGVVSSYSVLEDGSLRLINSVTSGGGSPNHASLSPSEEHIYVANSCGSVSVHAIDPATGAIEPVPLQIVPLNNVKEAVKNCESTSFLHQIYIRDANVYVVDRDRDIVTHYKRNPHSGLILTQYQDTVSFASGSGPRHLQFHPSGKFAFLISELANTITVLLVDGSGRLQPAEKYSTLREGEAAADMAAGEIQVSRDGRFVYGSNRDLSNPNLNRSSIVVFGFDAATAGLDILQHISSGGMHPRHFALFDGAEQRTGWGAVMVVANKDSDSLVTFVADANDGCLRPTGYAVSTLPYHDQPVYVGSASPS